MKRLILIRHAHRDTSVRERDNGLDELGHRQAKAVAKMFRKLEGKKAKALLVSSPKKRCIETLVPLGIKIESEVTIQPLLDEQNGITEDVRVFETRIRDFFKWAQKQESKIVVACSHGDWLPLAIEMMTGARAFTEKASYAELQSLGGRWLIYQLIQDPFVFEKNKESKKDGF